MELVFILNKCCINDIFQPENTVILLNSKIVSHRLFIPFGDKLTNEFVPTFYKCIDTNTHYSMYAGFMFII